MPIINICTGRNYSRIHLKNKYNAWQKECQTRKKLKGSEIGLGWDENKGVIVEEDERWDKMKLVCCSSYHTSHISLFFNIMGKNIFRPMLFVQENPTIEKFRFKELQFSYELECLFNNVASTQYCNGAPSSTSLELGEEYGYENDDGVNLEEGSGDFHEGVGNPTRVSGELNKVTFLSSQSASCDTSVKGKGPMSVGNTLGVKKVERRRQKDLPRMSSQNA